MKNFPKTTKPLYNFSLVFASDTCTHAVVNNEENLRMCTQRRLQNLENSAFCPRKRSTLQSCLQRLNMRWAAEIDTMML
jgi:hypothetical protein